MYVKGAPEIIIKNCSQVIDSSSHPWVFEEHEKSEMLLEMREKMTSKGLRVIAFSYKDFTEEEYN